MLKPLEIEILAGKAIFKLLSKKVQSEHRLHRILFGPDNCIYGQADARTTPYWAEQELGLFYYNPTSTLGWANSGCVIGEQIHFKDLDSTIQVKVLRCLGIADNSSDFSNYLIYGTALPNYLSATGDIDKNKYALHRDKQKVVSKPTKGCTVEFRRLSSRAYLSTNGKHFGFTKKMCTNLKIVA